MRHRLSTCLSYLYGFIIVVIVVAVVAAGLIILIYITRLVTSTKKHCLVCFFPLARFNEPRVALEKLRVGKLGHCRYF